MQRLPTGIPGLDHLLNGGYPAGRVSLIRGASGSGKSLCALMLASAQPGGAIYGTFDEAPERLQGYLSNWRTESDVHFLDFRAEDDLVNESFSGVELGGLLVRIEHALALHDTRVVILDAFDSVATTFGNTETIRRSMTAVFNWARNNDVTLLVTGGVDADYRSATGLMDYLADCVIEIGQAIEGNLMTRTLRVIKLRGAGHGTNVYPFLIDEHGIWLLPITDTALTAPALRERQSTGIPELDEALGGTGVWSGSTVLISGTSGTGKTIIAAHMAETFCKAGKKTLFLSFEESPQQLLRDVASVGISLSSAMEEGRLFLEARRAVERGVEEHLIWLFHETHRRGVDTVIIDPISALSDVASARSFKNLVLRVAHQLKSEGLTLVLLELIGDDGSGQSSLNMSSLIDTWIRLERVRRDNHFHRTLHVHKSRGSSTSSEVMDFEITARGLTLTSTTARQA